MGLARKLDTFGGLVICAVLYAYGRIRWRLGGQHLPQRRATTPPAGPRALPAPQRILTIKTYGLGNMAILMPVLASLRRAYPDAVIDMLTLDSNCGLIERTGLVDRTVPLRMGGLAATLASLVSIWRTTRKRQYDLVVDFEQFIKLSAIVAFLTGAKERIGFNTDGQRRGWLYTTRVVYTDNQHMSGIFLRLLLPLGIDATPAPFAVSTNADEDDAVSALLAEYGGATDAERPLVAVHVGSGPNFYEVPLKRWPVEHFAKLADELARRHGATIVFTGKGEEERELVERTRGLMKEPAVDACDRLGIGGLLALLRRCTLTVSNDTSVMHLSAAVETPVVAFFGATSPLQYGPLDPERHLIFYQDLFCSPCITNYNLKVSYCASPVCIRGIGVDEVLQGIERRYLGERASLGSVSPVVG
jgi:lipopolysaccharide heptosyltransferase II